MEVKRSGQALSAKVHQRMIAPENFEFGRG